MRFSLKLAILVIALGCVNEVIGKDKSIESSGFKVSILGKSGKLRYSKIGETDENRKVVVEMRKIMEQDATGKSVSGGKKGHAIMSLANQDFAFSSAIQTVLQDTNCTNINLTATLGTSAELKLMLYIINDKTELVNGDESMAGNPGDLKFNIQLTKWTFCGAGDDCKGKIGHQVCMYLIIKDNVISDVKIEKIPKKAKGKMTGKRRANVFAAGEGKAVAMPRQAMIDGTLQNLTEPVEIISDGGKSVFKFCFPKFNDTAFYDPLLGESDEFSSAAGVSLSSIPLLVFSLLVTLYKSMF